VPSYIPKCATVTNDARDTHCTDGRAQCIWSCKPCVHRSSRIVCANREIRNNWQILVISSFTIKYIISTNYLDRFDKILYKILCDKILFKNNVLLSRELGPTGYASILCEIEYADMAWDNVDSVRWEILKYILNSGLKRRDDVRTIL